MAQHNKCFTKFHSKYGANITNTCRGLKHAALALLILIIQNSTLAEEGKQSWNLTSHECLAGVHGGETVGATTTGTMGSLMGRWGFGQEQSGSNAVVTPPLKPPPPPPIFPPSPYPLSPGQY